LRSFFVPPVIGSSEDLAARLRALARGGIGHVQVRPEPSTVAGIEAFAPVLDKPGQHIVYASGELSRLTQGTHI
jgi:hypothetical protein